MTDNGEDFVAVIEDGDEPPAPEQVWKVLIVDDDEDVHHSTIFALSDKVLLGRRFVFTSAFSAAQAREIIRGDGDFAVILLDVVMETHDAGLHLVRFIRQDMGLLAPRIVLRTGHPGYAPEVKVIETYDINDYRTKSELTQVRLMTTMGSAVRSYLHINTIERSRQGLRQIIDASADLFRRRSLAPFAEGVLCQILTLLDLQADGVVVARQSNREDNLRALLLGSDQDEEPIVLAAAGRFADIAGLTLARVPDDAVVTLLRNALSGRENLFDAREIVLYVRTPSGDDLAIFLALTQPLTDSARQLLEVFSVNIAVGYDNASLFETVETLAFLDPLTRLANRTSFQQAVALRLAEPHEVNGARPGIFLIHLDDIDDVNAGLGYAAGDALLQSISARLAPLVTAQGTLARLSGDVFALLLEVADGHDDTIIERILACFVQPFAVDGSQVSIDASIGYCLADGETRDAARLVRKGITALNAAKRKKPGGVVPFTDAMEQDLNQRLTIIGRLREALEGSEFNLHYQPQVSLIDASLGSDDAPVVGVEALLRWRHADGSMIPPDQFIPAAEDSGRIVEIGEWVLRESCRQVKSWKTAGLPPMRVGVNVSIRQMKEPGFVGMVERIMAESGCEPSDLVIEVTESLLMEKPEMFQTMHDLHSLGLTLSLDDFGTGYSSLSRLHLLPLQHLKIDRSFIAGIHDRPACRSIVSMIVRMGHEMGLTVVAEGVETREQQDTLIALGCHEAQGYLYARALPPDRLEEFLRGRA